MSYRASKIISSASAASIMLAGTAIAQADSIESVVSKQAQQVVQEQDQTQFQSRQRLENRINDTGSGDHAAAQERNRNQHREQKRDGGQSMGQAGNRRQGTGAAPSGGRMAGKAGGGGRR